MNAAETRSTKFIEEWIESKTREFPMSALVATLRRTTKSGRLDEVALQGLLRELAKPDTKERREDKR
jgi:hypothetical protein